ncbi:MAG: nitrate/nitrite transporter NrtS [Chloroflexi bacterium]|nr:nitrate/nitrite transporter NrtS [Chloroflexota bacterium]
MSSSTPTAVHCEKCERELMASSYELPSKRGRLPHCLMCAVRFPSLLRKSLVICLLVGTVLTAINQGNFILAGEFQWAMAWKIPLTYAVPFIVATTGGLLNARAAIRTDA